MAKRDIKINYDDLGDTLGSIGTYRKALEELRDSVDKVNDIITASNDAETIDKLEKRYKKAKKRLDGCYEELDALYTLIDGYIDDMTAIIKPKKGLTRVGRNDIYWNLESIRDAVDYITDVQFSHNIWYSSGLGKTEEEKQAMERNYNRLQTEVWGNIFTPMKREVSASLKKLQGYYDHEVVDYENKDDSYKLKAVKVRYQYSSVWELFKQNGIDYVESNWKLVKGAVMAVVDLLKGLYSIGNMIYYYNSGKTAAIVMLISPDPPKWAEETLGESEDYFGNMTKAITHPVETLEAMAQNLNDTYEVEGLEYMGGYVIGDIVVGEISAAAVSKAVGKGAGAVDDIGNIANKADDVADIAETAGKMDDIAEIAETAGKADDVAKIADDIGDFYDDIYRGCYDEPFNPIEEGAILDPDDIAEIAADVPKSGTDFGKYSTIIDDKVTVVEKMELPESLAETFTDGEYRTVVTDVDITLYRDFGYKARANGGFATTSPAENVIQVKYDSAILPEWKNTLQYEAEIVVPKGTTLQVGKVAPQITKGGTVLPGGADQIILPQGWDDATWIKSVRELSVGGK